MEREGASQTDCITSQKNWSCLQQQHLKTQNKLGTPCVRCFNHKCKGILLQRMYYLKKKKKKTDKENEKICSFPDYYCKTEAHAYQAILEGCRELSVTPIKVSHVAESQGNNFFLTPNPFRTCEHI